MAILFITATKNQDFFSAALERCLPGKYYDIGEGQWLVSFQGTAMQLSDLIGLTGGDNNPGASGIILSIYNYYGRASSDVWEWLKQNWGETNG